MSDLTDSQRVERARQASMALETFLEPAFAVVEADYAEKLIAAASSTDPRAPEIIARLANGLKAARSARSQIEALVADGIDAQRTIERTEKVTELSPARQRLLRIGAI